MLVGGLRGHEIALFEPKENGARGESNRVLREADIAFGAPDAETLMTCENLRWLQINSAGYTAYDRPDLFEILNRRGTILTNSSAVYEESCAQHLLAMITSFARSLPLAHDEQRGERRWLIHALRPKIRLLGGQTVLILGFGAIGKRLAGLLAPLEMNLIGFKRTIRGDEPIRIIEESQVDAFLSAADHVVNILPANDSTVNFLSAERLANLKSGAILYNIGRGATIDQNALIKNLQNARIGGAFLDVTDPEPLPPEHALWSASNCYITPHIAGGHAREKQMQVEHFLNNLRRFERGEKMLNRIL